MALNYWAFIYLSPEFSPENNTNETASATCRFKTIGIDVFKKEQVLEVAKQLVAEGVQAIEVCGGFGPTWVHKICEAINYSVPVGGVMYGPEFRKPLLDVMQFN
jgi:hypothetical protein